MRITIATAGSRGDVQPYIALRAGIPSVVVPYFGDQAVWGRCAYELGAAAAPIKRSRLTAWAARSGKP